MNPFSDGLALILDAIADLQQDGIVPADTDLSKISVDPPRDAGFGDMASNAALILAKPARKAPMQIAEAIASNLADAPIIEKIEIAKPGFINITLKTEYWQARIGDVLDAGDDYGRNDSHDGRKINIEFCSVNPTGHLHVGHCRGTIFGDALAHLLAFSGSDVTREYYINDGGAQISALAQSIHVRYRELLGAFEGEMPKGLYPSRDLVPVARKILEDDGDRWKDAPEEAWRERFGRAGVDAMMALINSDLAALGVRFDVFSSERDLIESGKLDAALNHLDQKGLIYRGTLPPPKGKPADDWEPVELLLFKSTEFGDDVDRPLKSSAGNWTYLAADIANHYDKIERGSPELIDVWGADHGGYVKRVAAAVKAHGTGATFNVRLCQLVNLMDDGKPLKMSKRAGRITNLKDVIDEVGKDVLRFIILFRKNDAPLEFDLTKVTETSRENPVFYVQYAYARICSVFRNAGQDGMRSLLDDLASADFSKLTDEAEIQLIRQMATFPRIVESAAVQLEPHRISFYLHDLAHDFHSLWNRGKEQPDLRFLLPEDLELTRARLALLAAVRTVLANGMRLLGVDPVEELA